MSSKKVRGKRGSLSGMIILLLAAVLAVAGVVYFTGSSENSETKEFIDIGSLKGDFNDGEVCFLNDLDGNNEENCFNVEIADSESERNKGLMYYENLKSNEGMLFVFDDEGEHGMWMKNVKIPLDLLWINSEGRVVSAYYDAQPCSNDYCPTISNGVDASTRAKYVLEIREGMSSSLGIKNGDRAIITKKVKI